MSSKSGSKGQKTVVWKLPDWPRFHWDRTALHTVLIAATRYQGFTEGQLDAVGVEAKADILAEAWVQDALATSRIEGETLDDASIRSSVTKRLGLQRALQSGAGSAPSAEGLLDIMADAIRSCDVPLTQEILCGWHQDLFLPMLGRIRPVLRMGSYRDSAMDIVTGRHDRQTILYMAPPPERLGDEMASFIDWINTPSADHAIVRAGVAHLWFECIHPFEDGNGRIGRVVVDRLIATEIGQTARILRFSEQIADHRADYYAQLNRASFGTLDITEWLIWFVSQYAAACKRTSNTVELTLRKARFLAERPLAALNTRQQKLLSNMLSRGQIYFAEGLRTSKYESLMNVARATAYRDLSELVDSGHLRVAGVGKATRYFLAIQRWHTPDTISAPTANPMQSVDDDGEP